MSKIRTVCGDIDENSIGITYSHEHLHADHPSQDLTLTINDDDKTANEVNLFKKFGGNTIIEATVKDMGRNLESLRYISEKTNVNIVASTGNWIDQYFSPEMALMSVEDLANLYIKDIIKGEKGVLCGQIKVASSLHVIHPNEEKALKAACIAQNVTGAPIWIHHGGSRGLEIIDLLEKNGADLSKVILGHIDRNPDLYEHLQFVKRGVNVSVDNLDRVYRYPVQVNIDVIDNLIQHGYEDQIFISADFGRYTYYKSYGGGPGLSYILECFYPRLIDQLKLSEEQIYKLQVSNVRRVYAQF